MPYGIASAEPQDGSDDFDLSVSLYRPSDKAEQAIEGLQLRFPAATIGTGGPSVKELLERSHIWPNADAFGLVYALNPDLKGSGPLLPGGQLRLPILDPSPEIAKATSDGFWVRVRYDSRLIGEIVAGRERITALAAEAVTLPAARLAKGDATRLCVSNGSEDLSAIAGALQIGDRPIDHEMLLQVRGDVSVVSDILQRTLATGGQKMPVEDAEAICSVARDLRIKQETFGSMRSEPGGGAEKWPKVLVMVRTINIATQSQVSGLTVHYTPEALQDRPGWEKPVGGLSSPVSAPMPEADYVFWATRGAAVVSDRKKCSVREEGNKPFVCDLPVKP